MAGSFEEILYPHHTWMVAGGHYRCACLHTYEAVLYLPKQDGEEGSNVRDPEQADLIPAMHVQHVTEKLLAAGAEPPRVDPREKMRQRLADRGVSPSGRRDGR